MNDIEVQVLVNSKPLKQYWFENNWFIEARKGMNYEVKIKNNSWKRILAIVSVDGLSVLDGKPADSDSSGYIIDGYSSYSVKGFRVSNEEVNLFEFSDKNQSYAVKSPTGESSSANCGIIAVRVFEEKEAPRSQWVLSRPSLPDYPRPRIPKRPRRLPMVPDPDMPDPWLEPHGPIWAAEMLSKCDLGDNNVTDWMEQERERGPVMTMKCVSLNDTKSVTRSLSFGDMGTKFSEEKVTDKVREVHFEKGDLLKETSIFYASRQSLEELGIKFAPEPKVSTLPSGFKDKYCQPPKN